MKTNQRVLISNPENLDKEEKRKKAIEEDEYLERLRRIKRKKFHLSSRNRHFISDFYWKFIVAILGTTLVSIF